MQRMDPVVGLMSGTSMDGVDAALVETDGEEAVRPLRFVSLPYDEAERTAIRKALGAGDAQRIRGAETVVTKAHIRAVRHLLAGAGAPAVKAIGFHGHTVDHRPQEGFTLQVGDAGRLGRWRRLRRRSPRPDASRNLPGAARRTRRRNSPRVG